LYFCNIDTRRMKSQDFVVFLSYFFDCYRYMDFFGVQRYIALKKKEEPKLLPFLQLFVSSIAPAIEEHMPIIPSIAPTPTPKYPGRSLGSYQCSPLIIRNTPIKTRKTASIALMSNS
jgi:hypothetical protein